MADRSLNKAMNKDAYRGDLIQDLENGRIKLGDVKNEALPEDLLRLSGPDREREITRRLAERKMLKKQVLELAKKRDAFIAEQRKKSTKPGGFDSAVAAALNEQLQRRGIK
jgi:hypothetical protein